jgi:integrase
LEKSFAEAIARGYMRTNPLRNWKAEPHIVPVKKSLTLAELKQIFDGLPIGTVRDTIILLFVACKRRKEICKLQIENINFQEHLVHYTEFKNVSRSKCILKAFFLTAAMEVFLKRIIGDRTSGSLWEPSFHADFISHQFEEVSNAIAPTKQATLKNLRQAATDVMEAAGLSDLEIDVTLGHISVSKALPHYQDRSAEAIARRLSERTRKGIVVLSDAVAEYLK